MVNQISLGLQFADLFLFTTDEWRLVAKQGLESQNQMMLWN